MIKNNNLKTFQKANQAKQKKMEDKQMAKKVVLAGACRTAIGTMGGTLNKHNSCTGAGRYRDQGGSEESRRCSRSS